MKPSAIAQLITAVVACSLFSSLAMAQQGIDLARAAAAELAKELGGQEHVSYEEPARSYFDWGAIMRPDGRVLSVRQGSVAAAMGLLVDDQVTQVNQLELRGKSLTEVLQYLSSLEHGSSLTTTVNRAGNSQQFTATVLATVIPGWRMEIELPRQDLIAAASASSADCGRLSVFFQPKPVDHYSARIKTINGESNKSLNPNVILPVGEHVLGVVELINDPRLRRTNHVAREKELTVVIEAKTTYHMGPHFISSQRYQRVNQNYWEPVIWKVSEQSCSLRD
jgi:hypothetical protein